MSLRFFTYRCAYGNPLDTCLSQGFPAKELVVDVTGGKVPTSIGGVAAILSLGNKFQYVSTTSKKVLWYEIGYFRDEE